MLSRVKSHRTSDSEGRNIRDWGFYACPRCGGVVTGWAREKGYRVEEIFPRPVTVSEDVPSRIRDYLQQAIDTTHAPAGSLMLTASAVDAMLKHRGYTEGSLYSRIEKAADQHLITQDMAEWAHEVRLDANDQRHADLTAPLPTEQDAKRSIDFAMTLAQILFVLPARAKRGREMAADQKDGTRDETKDG